MTEPNNPTCCPMHDEFVKRMEAEHDRINERLGYLEAQTYSHRFQNKAVFYQDCRKIIASAHSFLSPLISSKFQLSGSFNN